MKTIRPVKIGVLLLAAAGAGILVAQNTGVVDFNLLFWRVSMSRIVLLLIAMAIDFLPGVISGYCQVDEKLVDRPPRYWARASREPAMRGINNGRRPQLDNTQLVADYGHRLPASRRAQKFPEVTSLRIALSRAWSATSFLSRVFSRSSSLSRLA